MPSPSFGTSSRTRRSSPRGPDPSGRSYQRLERVDGRSDDILELPARAGGSVRIHPYRLRAPFARLSGVRGYQIVHRPDGLLARVVPGSAGAELRETVEAGLAQAVTDAGADVSVRVELVTVIEREPGPAAKVKLVRSEL